jgi:hypothetical protein
MADRDVIIVDGPDDVLRAFVAGFLAGRAVDRDAVIYGSDLPLEHGSLTGALDGVVAIHRQLRDTDFVTADPIHLEERPLEGS